MCPIRGKQHQINVAHGVKVRMVATTWQWNCSPAGLLKIRSDRRFSDGGGNMGLLERTEKGALLCPFADIHVDMHITPVKQAA
jgi:hypothetical protein